MDPLARLLEVLGLNQDEPKKKGKKDKAAPAKEVAKDGEKKEPKGPKAATFQKLDASDLLPITSDELRTSLRELIRTGGWRFTGRGTIPTGDDRTRLINRALLTQGFLTPEQLDTIIGVANEYEQLQKALVILEPKANKAADKAAQGDKEERARIKAKKKAESLEKKRKYAEGVAHRKANDIIYLGGDNVSKLLNKRESEAEKLESMGLPVLRTPADIATVLGITVPRLRWLAYHSEVATRLHYIHFTVPKKSGGTRVLSAPHKSMALAQKWILTEILNKLPLEEPAHGFVMGRSILTNATPHVGKAVIINLDLESFFPSITWRRVRSVFWRLGYSPCVATILALICTECPRQPVTYDGKVYYVATGPRGLPQGACTSPALSNQVARKLDKRLGGLSRKMGTTYTRYADDLTISGDATLNEKVGYVLARVRHISENEGFVVNEKKTRVLRKNTAQLVTGIVVNEKPSLRRETLRRMRAILHQATKEGLDKANREERPNFRAWLHGMISYVHMVRPELGGPMLQQYQEALKKG